ncbi:MAG: L-serine ammonia-lyase [Leptolyngbyaceae cyanobacterium SL_7_1]|nr:L-serine ammonia-lyase [Leptolyngbyaceae cyanobacterium SL_7_1]
MVISVFELFKVGIGPSSSHTVGPMRAARRFLLELDLQALAQVQRVTVELFGALSATGKGHGTDTAILLGLLGEEPEHVDPTAIAAQLETIRTTQTLALLGKYPIRFCETDDLTFEWRSLPYHPNAMRLTAFDVAGEKLLAKTYYSVGGGFVIDGDATDIADGDRVTFPYPFKTASQLLALCQEHQLSISQLMLENEQSWRSPSDISQGLQHLWQVMQACVQRGCEQAGVLPGGLRVKRRAPELFQQLSQVSVGDSDPLVVMDWVNLFAIAVNEENAAGGRVVTAPTNGAAGIIPAVLHYYDRFCPHATAEGIERFLLTAGAIGILYKENASISGADVGCQGEVGVACSMAAGALTEVLGGTPEQVENAAEIGMEHHLGLTCDPVGGLVQIPCIERNAIAAIKAINASRMALHNKGHHYVSLDKVIKTMRDTGADMNSKYKETARGGLAVNMIEC